MEEGKIPSPTDELSPSSTRDEEQRTSSSSSELFDRLIQVPVKQPQSEVQRQLTPSEFLEFLSKPGTEAQPWTARSMTAGPSSSMLAKPFFLKEDGYIVELGSWH